MSLPKSKPLPIAIQQACIQERFPQFKYSRQKNAWIGRFKPMTKSPEYLVMITYSLYTIPKVFVIKPTLHPDAPHIYKKSGALCLYHPEDGSWNNRKLLGNTIFFLGCRMVIFL